MLNYTITTSSERFKLDGLYAIISISGGRTTLHDITETEDKAVKRAQEIEDWLEIHGTQCTVFVRKFETFTDKIIL